MRIEKDLQPGDTLEINTKTLAVKLNNAEADGFLAGEVFDLKGGTNSIEYTDGETGRSIEIEITFKPRHI